MHTLIIGILLMMCSVANVIPLGECPAARRLSENALFPKLFVILKKLSSEYQLDACGNFFRVPRFWKKLLFSDSLLVLISAMPGVS